MHKTWFQKASFSKEPMVITVDADTGAPYGPKETEHVKINICLYSIVHKGKGVYANNCGHNAGRQKI